MIKQQVGIVLSDKMEKTRVVRTERFVRHPLYGKTLKIRKKFYIHDESNQSKAGDKVSFKPMRPMSRLKRWELVEVLKG